MQQTTADKIREFVNKTHIEPARHSGQRQVTVQAGQVHSAMKLVSRLPQVCGAIGANIFATSYRVKLISRDGPQNGSTMKFTFEILP